MPSRFYEIGDSRADGSGWLRRSYCPENGAALTLFVWHDASGETQQMQLLFNECFVEWKGPELIAGHTDRAGHREAEMGRFKGVRTLTADRDPAVLFAAARVLRAYELPDSVPEEWQQRLADYSADGGNSADIGNADSNQVER